MPPVEQLPWRGGPPLMFWAGVAVAPVAAVLILFADGTGVLRVAAVLGVLATVLVSLSATTRDSVSMRPEVEEIVFDESDALRSDIREDIRGAVRSVHNSLTEKLAQVHDELAELRAELNGVRAVAVQASERAEHEAARMQTERANERAELDAARSQLDVARADAARASERADRNAALMQAARADERSRTEQATVRPDPEPWRTEPWRTPRGTAAVPAAALPPAPGYPAPSSGLSHPVPEQREPAWSWTTQQNPPGYRDLVNNGYSWSEPRPDPDDPLGPGYRVSTEPADGSAPARYEWRKPPEPPEPQPDRWSSDRAQSWSEPPYRPRTERYGEDTGYVGRRHR